MGGIYASLESAAAIPGSSGGGSRVDTGAIFLLLVTICAFMVPVLLIFPPVPPRRSDALYETHTKLGIEPSRPNTKDQHDAPKHDPRPGSQGTIQSLWVYPVKSCRGIEVTRSKVLPAGLEFDRLFTFAQLKSTFPAPPADAREETQHRWEFVTQRQFPLLATLEVELWRPDVVKCRGKDAVGSDGSFVVLRFPWRDAGAWGLLQWLAAKIGRGMGAQPEKEIILPVEFPSAADIEEKGYEYDEVRVWKDTVTALDMRSELPAELALYLGVSNKLALFRVDPKELREVYRCAPRVDVAGYQTVTGFQDAYPLHLLNLSSVEDFFAKVPKDRDLQDIDARRFRANIIVSGPEAYDEESWKSIRFRPTATQQLDEAKFQVSCRTVRCKMPNVDPKTGVRHPVQPDKSLRAFRDVDDGAPKLGCLGMQLCPLFSKTDRPEHMETHLAVGMTLDVLERGSHHYIKQ